MSIMSDVGGVASVVRTILFLIIVSSIITTLWIQPHYFSGGDFPAIQAHLEGFRGDASSPKKIVARTSGHADVDEGHIQSSPRVKKEKTDNGEYVNTLAHLSCHRYGGPPDASEMVYWHDIPSDEKYVSPFHSKQGQHKKYMTFEPDGGGWNNIRMAMETVLAIGISTGRTVVLPPEQRMYLLRKNKGSQKTDFGFTDFFPMKELASENAGLRIISTKEFLEAEAMTGNMRDIHTGRVTFPPQNRTDWDGQDVAPLKEWLRNSTLTPLWSPGKCMAAFPASGDHKDVVKLRDMMIHLYENSKTLKTPKFLEEPAPVDASPMERLRENINNRRELCVYNETMQQAPVIHFMCYHKLHVRMLVHFYAFLFYEDWREDLWMKRFMRDHMRYIDEIQCAAARVVKAMRSYAISQGGDGTFDTFHIRRGDFQFKDTRIDAAEIIANTEDILDSKIPIFIATDERDRKFFDKFRDRYDVKFLDDFMGDLQGINANFYGMIDQLVASRGRNFFGCWHSTFTGFINRMRGYHVVNQKLLGYDRGLLLNSYYYATIQNKMVMHKYAPLQGAIFNREFPTAWRDLDKSVGNLPNSLQER